MKLNSDLPGFYGYYGTFLDDPDTSGELDYINQERESLGLPPLENTNEFEFDYEDYQNRCNKTVTNAVEKFLIDEGFIKSIKFVKLHSPKEYNFTNDKIECIIDVNVANVKAYIKENIEAFSVYLEAHFKSRSGFISFYEYDLETWLDAMKSFKNLDNIEIYSILDFILQIEGFDYNERLGDYDYLHLLVSNTDYLLTLNTENETT